MSVSPLLPAAWEAGGDLFDSPLPSLDALQSGQYLDTALSTAIDLAWGDVTGRLLGTLTGAWGVDLASLGDVTDLFEGDAWKSPATWVGVGSTATSLVLTALGSSVAVIQAVPIVGQVVGAVAALVAAIVAGVTVDEIQARPRGENAPPVYSREGDESWTRQLQLAARELDHQTLWSGTHYIDTCYTPGGSDGCPWGLGINTGPGSLMPGSGYWPGLVCEPAAGGSSRPVSATRPAAAAFASLLEASYLGTSGAVWSVDARALEEYWLVRSLAGLASLPPPQALPLPSLMDWWPVGDGDGSALVLVPDALREDLAALLPVASLQAHVWPVYLWPGGGPPRLRPVRRISAQYDGQVGVTRTLFSALTARVWARHQTAQRAYGGSPALAMVGQPGFSRPDALRAVRRLSAHGLTRIREPSLISGAPTGLAGAPVKGLRVTVPLPSPP